MGRICCSRCPRRCTLRLAARPAVGGEGLVTRIVSGQWTATVGHAAFPHKKAQVVVQLPAGHGLVTSVGLCIAALPTTAANAKEEESNEGMQTAQLASAEA